MGRNGTAVPSTTKVALRLMPLGRLDFLSLGCLDFLSLGHLDFFLGCSGSS